MNNCPTADMIENCRIDQMTNENLLIKLMNCHSSPVTINAARRINEDQAFIQNIILPVYKTPMIMTGIGLQDFAITWVGYDTCSNERLLETIAIT
ncbi:hypothetical protein DERP_010433 [Dermatophagoides pteronyssinus]|uniref:Uncharacterized protein n=1 Tax=Dermatophagoides pteronyssinus TaxID=6956 RepID=A0ABQ8J4W7_DERPT|nr:hypothetical protein DERP_010433 [Dermatophagoides pteronyssinus]